MTKGGDRETVRQRQECMVKFQKLDDAVIASEKSVARIDINLNNHITELKSSIKDLGVELKHTFDIVETKLDTQNDKIDKQLKEIMGNTAEVFATKEEVKPLKQVIYGMIGFILLAVLSAIIYGVITK